MVGDKPTRFGDLLMHELVDDQKIVCMQDTYHVCVCEVVNNPHTASRGWSSQRFDCQSQRYRAVANTVIENIGA